MEHVENEPGALFLKRAQSRPLAVGPADAPVGSRVGGTPPAPLAAAPPECPACGGSTQYILTLAGDVLGEQVARGRAVSLLTCADVACRMKSHEIVEPSSLLLVVHDDAPRAAPGSSLDSAFEGRRLVLRELTENEESRSSDESKVGGLPGYLQPWGDEEAAKARADGADFLFQWSEVSYPRTMKRGPYPFLFGTVYVFSRLDPTTRLPTLGGLVGFWQNA